MFHQASYSLPVTSDNDGSRVVPIRIQTSSPYNLTDQPVPTGDVRYDLSPRSDTSSVQSAPPLSSFRKPEAPKKPLRLIKKEPLFPNRAPVTLSHTMPIQREGVPQYSMAPISSSRSYDSAFESTGSSSQSVMAQKRTTMERTQNGVKVSRDEVMRMSKQPTGITSQVGRIVNRSKQSTGITLQVGRIVNRSMDTYLWNICT